MKQNYSKWALEPYDKEERSKYWKFTGTIQGVRENQCVPFNQSLPVRLITREPSARDSLTFLTTWTLPSSGGQTTRSTSSRLPKQYFLLPMISFLIQGNQYWKFDPHRSAGPFVDTEDYPKVSSSIFLIYSFPLAN